MHARRLLTIVLTVALSATVALPPAVALGEPGGTPSGGTVTGVVYSPDGVTPVASAMVIACQGAYPCAGSAMSGTDGAFTLTNVPVNMDVATAFPPWGQPDWFKGSSPMVVTSGATTNADVRLIHGARASGTVFEPDATTPVPSGTQVVYHVSPGSSQSMGITTGPGGAYQTPWLAPGGTLTITAGPSSIGTTVSSGALPLAESDDRIGLDLVLVGGGGWIVGTVTGSGGALAGAWVSVPSAGSPAVTTDASGVYRTLAMHIGDFTVSVQPPFGANLLPASRSVTVVAGANTVAVDLAVGGILSGSVTAADGSPLAAGSTQACSTPSQCSYGSVSGGSYTLSGLATGTYTLKVTMNGLFPAPSVEQTGISVVAGQTTPQNMSFAPGVAPPATTSSVSAFVASGGTVSTLGPLSLDNPVVTQVESPVPATIDVLETTIDQGAPSGITFLGQQVNIDLHGATTTADQPFVFTFSVAIGTNDPGAVVVYRYGIAVGGCTTGAMPCVASRTLTSTGIVLVVWTTQASPWNFSIVPYSITGFFPPVAMGGEINEAKAGRTIPMKFSLGGDRGLGVLAQGSPSSVAVPCPNDPSPTSVDTVSGGGGLSYDASTARYTWKWSTNDAWRGCRRLDVTLADGSVLRAVFRFR